MASAHDRAVLQAIFNPTTPFGDIPGLNQEEELIDDGERELLTWCVSTYHVTAFYVYHFIAYWIYLNTFHLWTKKTWHFNPSWVLGDSSVFSLPRYLSIEFEWFSTCLSPPSRQWLWHRVAEASERVGDAGCFSSRGWGFASCTSTVQPGNPDPASASLSL